MKKVGGLFTCPALALMAFAALTLRAAEVTEAVAKEVVAGWASLQEALTAKDRFAGAAVAKVETFSGRDGLGVSGEVRLPGTLADAKLGRCPRRLASK